MHLATEASLHGDTVSVVVVDDGVLDAGVSCPEHTFIMNTTPHFKILHNTIVQFECEGTMETFRATTIWIKMIFVWAPYTMKFALKKGCLKKNAYFNLII